MVGESGTGNTPVMEMCSRSAWHCLHRLLGVEVFLASAYNVASDVRLEHRPWMEPPWLRRLCLEGKPSGECLGRKRTATWTTRRYGKHGECRLRGRQTNGNDKATSKLQVGAVGAICVADLSGSEGPLGTRRERGHRQKKRNSVNRQRRAGGAKAPAGFNYRMGAQSGKCRSEVSRTSSRIEWAEMSSLGGGPFGRRFGHVRCCGRALGNLGTH